MLVLFAVVDGGDDDDDGVVVVVVVGLFAACLFVSLLLLLARAAPYTAKYTPSKPQTLQAYHRKLHKLHPSHAVWQKMRPHCITPGILVVSCTAHTRTLCKHAVESCTLRMRFRKKVQPH